MRTFVLAGMLVVASTGVGLTQEAGKAVFDRFCLPCHDVGDGARIKLGPPLNGIDGRKAGTFEGFNYSDAVKNANFNWNEAQFKEFIKNPQQKFPGTRMAFTGLREEADVNNIWDFLKSFAADGKKK
jgi:cytochrome c